MKKELKIGICIGLIVFAIVFGAIGYHFSTISNLVIKYIPDDKVRPGGNVLILIDYLSPKSSDWKHVEGNAGQYTIFSGLSIGKHIIEIDTGVWGDENGTLLARGDITTHAAIYGDTILDLHYGDGGI